MLTVMTMMMMIIIICCLLVCLFFILFQSHTTNIIIEKRFRIGTRCVEVIVLKTDEVLKFVFSLMFFLSVAVCALALHLVCAVCFFLHSCPIKNKLIREKARIIDRL